MEIQPSQRNLNTLFLPQHIRYKLKINGFSTVNDLLSLAQSEISKIAQFTQEEVTQIFDIISDANNISSLNARDMLHDEESSAFIPTFSKAVDDILGGGISLKKLTEVCGLPGAGKTQLCLQLCVTVQIPRECGGLDGEAIYIDTEGSFTFDRFSAIVEAAVKKCEKILRIKSEELSAHQTYDNSFTRDKVFAGFYYFFCKDFIDLMAMSNLLPDFLKKHPKVNLIVVDSIAFHFRYGFEKDYVKRNRLLYKLSCSFIQIAQQFPVAVLLTNQMTTRFGETDPSLVPALGDSWSHTCTIRIMLTWDAQKRQASILKSPYTENAIADFEIITCGIRDCSAINVNLSSTSSNISNGTATKQN